MKWNWQHKNWPNFRFNHKKISQLEEEFIFNSGLNFGVYKHLNKQDQENLTIELIASEALKTSAIEGEMLNRDSLQSSIKRSFNLTAPAKKIAPAEKGISDMMIDLYRNFDDKLSHRALFSWHEMLTKGRRDLSNIGKYRNHDEPMQIISKRLDEDPEIHFEAPPSKRLKKEMGEFIAWFNNSRNQPALARAAIAHLYFVSIHPFEDGNGRIARALAIKALSQSNKQPLLTSLSTIIEKGRKKYYKALEQNNRCLEVDGWMEYFAKSFIESQNYTQKLIEFLLAKTRMYDALRGEINERQEKVLKRMFAAGLDGFEGGLSAENYIRITKTSRATATRDLQDLVEKGALMKSGELKGTRYFLGI